MTDTEKYEHLLKVLKEYAEKKHCYDKYGDFYYATNQPQSRIFDDGSEYGEILFARTLLEQIGVKLEYPCEKKND
jgi:hypothetical protein